MIDRRAIAARMKKKPSDQKKIQSRKDQEGKEHAQQHAEEKWIRNVDGPNDDIIGLGPRGGEEEEPPPTAEEEEGKGHWKWTVASGEAKKKNSKMKMRMKTAASRNKERKKVIYWP